MKKSGPVILWFRNDLRLSDNRALNSALETGKPVIAVYIDDEASEGAWPPGSASKWWLHHALSDLTTQLEKTGCKLHLFKGDTVSVLQSLIKETNAEALFFARRYEPVAIAFEDKLIEALKNIQVIRISGNILLQPWEVKNKSGKPFQVFSAFWRHIQILIGQVKTLSPPREIKSYNEIKGTVTLETLALLPSISWDTGFYDFWDPSRKGAEKALESFIEKALLHYETGRDLPSQAGTSKLSPYLHFGLLSPQEVWQAVSQASLQNPKIKEAATCYLREIAWREFAHHLLYHFPETDTKPLRPEFKNFPWGQNAKYLQAWQQGKTGYPIVDAGMRELWHTGWMHNRVRMIVASFLVKDLLISWQEGSLWFWDTLVDADLANNSLGWQWVAGCGADASPYFRVFNPVLQSKKFDAKGDYIRQWVPEISKLSDKYIHEPWTAPPEALVKAGISLGATYPKPIVDHAQAKQKSLDAFFKLKKEKRQEELKVTL